MSLYRQINRLNLLKILQNSTFYTREIIDNSSNKCKVRRLHCSRPSMYSVSHVNADKQTNIGDLLDSATSTEPHPENVDENWATMPYPKGAVLKRDQSRHALQPTCDPREVSIILFPGQGSQYVGMGKDLLRFPIARDLFEGASEILGYDLLKLCLQGPKEELDKTVHCQPAVMVASLAALERLKEERPAAIENCVATAGFSLGELTALVFSGALSFERGLKLVRVRAEAMQVASDLAAGGMSTVLYGPDSQLGHACLRAREWCIARGLDDPQCTVANYLFPHCKVVAGNVEALEFLEQNAAQFKLKRLKRLPVSGAFHTELMRPAMEPFRTALRKTKVEDPLIAVHSNLDGKRYRNVDHIVRQLPKQMVKPVKWEQTLHVLYERATGQHFPRTFECGPGASLKTVLKNVNAKAWNTCLNVTA